MLIRNCVNPPAQQHFVISRERFFDLPTFFAQLVYDKTFIYFAG